MESKFLKIENKNEWQDLLDKVLFKTFFHFWEWEEFLEKTFSWLRFERYSYQDKAILSLARARGKLISHPFCEYGGPLPLIEKIDGRAFSRDLLEQFKDIHLKISFHPQLLKYFQGMEFPENQRETFFFEDVDKKTSDELWQTIDRNRHRSIKQAESQNFKTEECNNLKDLKELYALYVKNLKQHRALPYPFSFFKFFMARPDVRISLLKTQLGKLVGGNIFVLYNQISHSFLCGFQEKYKKLGVHSLVLWQEIEKSRESGLKAFDFGATKKDSSIKEFKNRWGAKLYPIQELKNYSGDSKMRDSWLRDVWGRLPVLLIKKLSPYLLKYKL